MVASAINNAYKVTGKKEAFALHVNYNTLSPVQLDEPAEPQ